MNSRHDKNPYNILGLVFDRSPEIDDDTIDQAYQSKMHEEGANAAELTNAHQILKNPNTRFEVDYGPNIFIRLTKNMDANQFKDAEDIIIDEDADLLLSGVNGLLSRFFAFIEFLPAAVIAFPLMLLRDIIIKPCHEAYKKLTTAGVSLPSRLFDAFFEVTAGLVLHPLLNLGTDLTDISSSYTRTALGVHKLTSFKIGVFATLASITLMALIAFPPTAGIAALVGLGVQMGVTAGLGAWSTGLLIAAAGLVTKFAVQTTGIALQGIGNFFLNLGNEKQEKVPLKKDQELPDHIPSSLTDTHVRNGFPLLARKQITPKAVAVVIPIVVQEVASPAPSSSEPQPENHSPTSRR